MRATIYAGFRDEMEKLARLWPRGCCSPAGIGEQEWADQFKGTPFYKDALALQKDDAGMEAQRARERAQEEARFAQESAFRVRVAELEARLAEWRYQNMGLEPAKTEAKTAAAQGGGNLRGHIREELIRRAQAKYPDVPREKIAQMVDQALAKRKVRG